MQQHAHIQSMKEFPFNLYFFRISRRVHIGRTKETPKHARPQKVRHLGSKNVSVTLLDRSTMPYGTVTAGEPVHITVVLDTVIRTASKHARAPPCEAAFCC